MSNTEQNVGVKGLAVICLILLSIVLGMNSPVSAVNSHDITWKDSSASAVSGKCLQQGLVRSGAVCLPGKAEGTLNWQPKPVQGKSCIRSGVSYKSLTCNKVGNRLKWVIQTTDESASEIASNFAAAMSKITDNLLVTGMKVAKQKLDALWFKNKALGAKLSWFDSELSPETTRGTYAEWSYFYRIEIQGQSFCYISTYQGDEVTTVYVLIDCNAAQVVDVVGVPLYKALQSYRMKGDLAAFVSTVTAFENTYAKEGLKVNYLDSSRPKLTIFGQQLCFTGMNFEGSC